MIYTSSFSKYRDLPPTVVPVAITTDVPYHYEGCKFDGLTPSDDLLSMCKARNNWELFKTLYHRECLVDLKPADVYKKLMDLGNGRDVCLLTHESPDNNESVRNILIGWFTTAGLPCEEFTF